MNDQPAIDFIHPSFGRAVAIADYQGLAETDEQVTAGTILLMAQIVREDSRAENVRQAAADAVREHAAGTTETEIITSVFDWIKQHVTFVGDEEQIEPFDFFFPPEELLIRPSLLLQMPRPKDDCDGFSMLTAAMLRALGIKSYFKTVAANRDIPERYSHVYVLAETSSGKRIALDTSHGPAPGLEVKPVFKERVWPIEPPRRRNPARTLPAAAAPPGLRAIDWNAIIKGSMDIAKPVLTNRYGVPPPGTYIQRDQQGNEVVSTFPGGGISAAGNLGGNGLVILAIAGIAVLVLVSSGGNRGR